LLSVLHVQDPDDICPPPFVHVDYCMTEAKLIKDGDIATAVNTTAMTIAIVIFGLFM
jgi:hypothetical protein